MDNQENSRTIKFKLRELMKLRGVTQQQLAYGAGVTRLCVRQLQNGTVQLLDVVSLTKICNYLGVDIQDVMELN